MSTASRVRVIRAVVVSGVAALVLVGGLSSSAVGAGYQLNGLGAGCTEPGNTNTVHGNKFDPGSNVQLLLGSTQIGVLKAGDTGDVDGQFTVPSNTPQGTTTVKLVGTGAEGERTLSFSLQIGNCEGAPIPPPTGGGNLAFTGGNTGMTVGIAAALLVVGAALVGAVSRKKRSELENVS